MNALANLIFRVVRRDEEPVIAKAMARSPPDQQGRRRNTSARVVQKIWCLDDVLAAAATDDSTVECVLIELVIRQIHQPDAKEKPDDNAHTCQQDSKLAL